MAGFIGLERDGDVGVIAYTSRRFKPSKCVLSMFQLELIAIVSLCNYFADYLLDKVGTVHTDSKSITE